MNKLPGLPAQARKESQPFGEISEGRWGEQPIGLITWTDHDQIAVLQGADAVVIDRAQAAALVVELNRFLATEPESCDCADKAPRNEYWTCPKCDAEWHPETPGEQDA